MLELYLSLRSKCWHQNAMEAQIPDIQVLTICCRPKCLCNFMHDTWWRRRQVRPLLVCGKHPQTSAELLSLGQSRPCVGSLRWLQFGHLSVNNAHASNSHALLQRPCRCDARQCNAMQCSTGIKHVGIRQESPETEKHLPAAID